MYGLVALAFAATALAAAAPQPTARQMLPRHWISGSASASTPCIGNTKTLFGPYTLKYPIAGFDNTDTFYAVEKADGTVELSVHGEHDLPLGNHGSDEVLDGETYTLSWGGQPTPYCEPVTKKVKHGSAGFPTAAPIWPREVFGFTIKPEARTAAPEPTAGVVKRKMEM